MSCPFYVPKPNKFRIFAPTTAHAELASMRCAVMSAYGFSTKMTESECVAELFKLYQQLTKRD